MSLEELLKARIRQSGPLSIAEYMAAALTHPEYGYYTRNDPLGVKGDFITAPEISQIFGELLGLWLAEQWLAQGSPHGILVEPGPGRGTLMNDALRATRNVPGFHEAMSVYLIEKSPVLKQKQWETLSGKHPRIAWHEDFSNLPAGPLFLMTNEFFDALPLRQFTRTEGVWRERLVGIDESGKLQLVLAQAEPPVAFPEADNIIYEYSEPSVDVAAIIARHIAAHGGAAIIVDYGYSGGTRGDTLQAIKNHHFHGLLEEPGTADLSAHVDFDALKSAAEQEGAAAYGPVSQGTLLRRLGAQLRAEQLCANSTPRLKASVLSGLERLLSPDSMGDLFKAICILPKTRPKPEGF